MISNPSIDRVQFTADGTATTFSCAPLEILDPSALVVYAPNGSEFVAERTVVGVRAAYGAQQAASAFSLRFDDAPGAGVYTVVRTFTLGQPLELLDFAPWSPKVIESALDRGAIVGAGLWGHVQRSLRGLLSETTPMSPLPAAHSRADRLLGFDAQGQPVMRVNPTFGLTAQASISQFGNVRLATVSESHGLLEQFGVMTPGRAPLASETQRGFIRTATGSEAAALSLTNVAVPPSALANVVGAQVTSAERTAGTAAGIKRFSPADVKSMIDTHANAVAGNAATWARAGKLRRHPGRQAQALDGHSGSVQRPQRLVSQRPR